MVFLAVLNWMLDKSPGFIKPAVNWLLEGLRRITGWIASRWNWLGVSVLHFLAGVVAWRTALWDFVDSVWKRIVWLAKVVVPQAISALRIELRRIIDAAGVALRKLIDAAAATLRKWAQAGLAALSGLLSALKTWATAALNKLIASVADLVKRLFPVLNGPAVLAEWLIAALWRAAYRYAYAQRDRITQWLLSGSPSFTRWVASVVEDLIVRWL